MTPRVLEKIVAAPRPQVFALFADIAGAQDVLSGVTRIELLTPGPVGAGTRWKETRVMFGREHTEELAIAEFEAPEKYAVQCCSCGVDYRTEFSFHADGDRTRVVQSLECRPVTFWARLFSPLSRMMIGSMLKALDADLEQLKARAEADARGDHAPRSGADPAPRH